MVLIPSPRDVRALVQSFARHRVTLAPAVPALINAVLNYPRIERLDLTSVKRCFSGAAPLSVDVMERFERLPGAVIVEGFGLTGASPGTHCKPVRVRRKPGSTRVPLPHT